MLYLIHAVSCLILLSRNCLSSIFCLSISMKLGPDHELCSWRGAAILLVELYQELFSLYWNFAKGITARKQGNRAIAEGAFGNFEACWSDKYIDLFVISNIQFIKKVLKLKTTILYSHHSFSRSSWSHNHQAVPNYGGLIELDTFTDETIHVFQK